MANYVCIHKKTHDQFEACIELRYLHTRQNHFRMHSQQTQLLLTTIYCHWWDSVDLAAFRFLHTYIICHYNLSVRIIDLVSYTTYVVCFNFICKWRNLLFNVDSEWQIVLRNFSWLIFIYSKSFCQKSVEKQSPKKYFFVFCFDVSPGARTLALSLISQQITY